MFDEKCLGKCYQMFQTADPVTFGQNWVRPVNFPLTGYTYHDHMDAATACSYNKIKKYRRLL